MDTSTGFRIISNDAFQAFSRSEKLDYLRSAIEAHRRFAAQQATDTLPGDYLATARRGASASVDSR